ESPQADRKNGPGPEPRRGPRGGVLQRHVLPAGGAGAAAVVATVDPRGHGAAHLHGRPPGRCIPDGRPAAHRPPPLPLALPAPLAAPGRGAGGGAGRGGPAAAAARAGLRVAAGRGRGGVPAGGEPAARDAGPPVVPQGNPGGRPVRGRRVGERGRAGRRAAAVCPPGRGDLRPAGAAEPAALFVPGVGRRRIAGAAVGGPELGQTPGPDRHAGADGSVGGVAGGGLGLGRRLHRPRRLVHAGGHDGRARGAVYVPGRLPPAPPLPARRRRGVPAGRLGAFRL
ncbi:MAG: hypothetical protein AVDCRST_MAG56-5125, partial [uncultured Cytophagales bacterium]